MCSCRTWLRFPDSQKTTFNLHPWDTPNPNGFITILSKPKSVEHSTIVISYLVSPLVVSRQKRSESAVASGQIYFETILYLRFGIPVRGPRYMSVEVMVNKFTAFE